MLLDPQTRRAAAYNGTHRLITEEASAALIDYALRPGHQTVAYDEAKQDPSGRWRPLPAWATPEVRQRLALIWVRSGRETDEELRAMPQK